MTEEVLQQFPDVSEFPTNVNIKSTNEVLKQAIIEANPDFASLNWDDFEFKNAGVYVTDVWDEDNFVLKENRSSNFTLKLKDNPDRIRYYRKRTPYQFNFTPLDAKSIYQALFGPLINKSFKFELKDQLATFMESLPYGTNRVDLAFADIKLNDNEIYYFFSFDDIRKNNDYRDINIPNIYYNLNNHVYPSLKYDEEKTRQHIDYLKQHIPYIRFVAEAVPEDQLISTPDQPTQPNLTINPSNVYTVS